MACTSTGAIVSSMKILGMPLGKAGLIDHVGASESWFSLTISSKAVPACPQDFLIAQLENMFVVELIHKAKVVGEPIVILDFVWRSLFLQVPLLTSERSCLFSLPQGKLCPFQCSASRDWLSQQMLAHLFKCPLQACSLTTGLSPRRLYICETNNANNGRSEKGLAFLKKEFLSDEIFKASRRRIWMLDGHKSRSQQPCKSKNLAPTPRQCRPATTSAAEIRFELKGFVKPCPRGSRAKIYALDSMPHEN